MTTYVRGFHGRGVLDDIIEERGDSGPGQRRVFRGDYALGILRTSFNRISWAPPQIAARNLQSIHACHIPSRAASGRIR